MPAKSKAQLRFMEAVAHGMKPRKGNGPSKSQAEEFVEASKNRKLPARVGPKPKPKKSTWR